MDAEEDAIFRLIYELNVDDHTLDGAQLEQRCPLDNGRLTFSSQVQHSVGRLDDLPVELVTEILLALDLPTLTNFRRVNRRAMTLVDSLHQYRMILKHCPDILRAIVSIRASSYGCKTLFETLCATKCATCHNFGGHLYLIDCRRVCWFCFSHHIDYFPLSAWQASRLTAIPKKKVIASLPHIVSLPGRYGTFAKKCKDRVKLVDRSAVSSIAPAGTVPPPAIDYKTREIRRHMAIISAPFFSHTGQTAEWGLHCRRCRSHKEPPLHFRLQFTRQGLWDHIQRDHKTG